MISTLFFRKLGPNWKYAVAELLIIVSGVLIALAVDNWNQGLKERALERQYLESLAEDLRDDIDELDLALRMADLNEGAARLALRVQSEGSAAVENPADLVVAVERAGFLYLPSYSPFTFEDLKSTGNLRIIRNPELKKRLAAYYSETLRGGQWNSEYRRREAVYEAEVTGILGIDQRASVSLDQPIEASEEDVERIARQLRDRPAIGTALEEMVWVQIRVRRDLTAVQEICREVLELVEEEIRRLS